jgi:SAM-dependent methyltransferase
LPGSQGDTVTEADAEIPSPIDFHDAAQVHNWITQTVQQRVWRPRFFAAFAAALNETFEAPIDVVELGSGPGQLAAEVLAMCRVNSYAAVDFSAAMHSRAAEHLGESAARVNFVLKDFRRDDWADGLAPADAALTMPAAHEVRHRDRQPALLRRISDILRPNGILLFCDHYDDGSSKPPGLYFPHDEQPDILRAAGFQHVEELLDLGGMALYRAHRS